MSGLRDIGENFAQDSIPLFGRHGLMPAAVIGSKQLDRGSDRFGAELLRVVRKTSLPNQGKQMIAVGNQVLQQTFVNRQVLWCGILDYHPLILVFAEKTDFLIPNRNVGVQTPLRIVAKDQTLDRTPLSFQCCHDSKFSGFLWNGQLRIRHRAAASPDTWA